MIFSLVSEVSTGTRFIETFGIDWPRISVYSTVPRITWGNKNVLPARITKRVQTDFCCLNRAQPAAPEGSSETKTGKKESPRNCILLICKCRKPSNDRLTIIVCFGKYQKWEYEMERRQTDFWLSSNSTKHNQRFQYISLLLNVMAQLVLWNHKPNSNF